MLGKAIEIAIAIGIAIEIENNDHTNRVDPDFDPENKIEKHPSLKLLTLAFYRIQHHKKTREVDA